MSSRDALGYCLSGNSVPPNLGNTMFNICYHCRMIELDGPLINHVRDSDSD